MGPKKPKVLPFQKKGLARTPGSASKIDISASSEKPAALTEDELRVQVQRIVCYGTIRESWHARSERSYRNVSMDDIQHMLRGPWKLAQKPEWNIEHGNWTYKLTGEDLDDDELTLVIAPNVEEQKIFIVTKY